MPIMLDNLPFGFTNDGERATLHVLKSPTVEVDVSDYGATVVGIRCLDKFSRMDDVISGFSGVHGYERHSKQIGSVVEHGCSEQNGRSSDNSIGKKIWKSETNGTRSVTFKYVRRDDEDGQKGNVNLFVKYKLQGSQLQVQHMATTDRDTTINMTNKLYFNLSGHTLWSDLKHHLVTLYSNSYIDSYGETRSVENTVFDLRKPTFLSNDRIVGIQPTQEKPNGRSFCLSPSEHKKLVARIKHVSNGRIVTIETSQPFVSLDCASDFDLVEGKNGVKYNRHSCVAVTPQNHPPCSEKIDAPQRVNLKAGDSFGHSTWYSFSHTL
ncbi:galactose mutarotase-like [Styela clava]